MYAHTFKVYNSENNSESRLRAVLYTCKAAETAEYEPRFISI